MNRDSKGKFISNSQKRYTLFVKIPAYYEVEVNADSFAEASEKVKSVNTYELLTKNPPFDSDPAELISVTLVEFWNEASK